MSVWGPRVGVRGRVLEGVGGPRVGVRGRVWEGEGPSVGVTVRWEGEGPRVSVSVGGGRRGENLQEVGLMLERYSTLSAASYAPSGCRNAITRQREGKTIQETLRKLASLLTVTIVCNPPSFQVLVVLEYMLRGDLRSFLQKIHPK